MRLHGGEVVGEELACVRVRVRGGTDLGSISVRVHVSVRV